MFITRKQFEAVILRAQRELEWMDSRCEILERREKLLLDYLGLVEQTDPETTRLVSNKPAPESGG